MSEKPLTLRFTITATLLGNTLEWYDIATFGFLTPVLTQIFFPAHTPWSALIYSMNLFFIGTIIRPLGGLLFGFIGDHYGRRKALIASIVLMSIPTFCIGILPTYHQIGITALYLLFFLRILQGLAAGGEFPGVVAFLNESSPEKKRSFFASFAYFGVALGIFLGALDFFFLEIHLSDDAFRTWGWRSVYILGGVLGATGFLLRRKLHETPIFKGMKESHEILHDPVKILFTTYKKRLGQLVGIEILETLAFNVIITFSLVYLIEILKISTITAIRMNIVFFAFLVATVPFAGNLSSRIGAKKLATYAAAAYFLFSLPLYWLLSLPQFRFPAIICLAILVGFYMAPMPYLYSELFPSRVRVSGIGMGYNLTVGIIGGTAPLLALGTIRLTHFNLTPALLLMLAALISLATLRTIKS